MSSKAGLRARSAPGTSGLMGRHTQAPPGTSGPTGRRVQATPSTNSGAGRRTLVLVPGALGERLTGPEIRAWEFAKALALDRDVTAVAQGGVAQSGASGERDGVRIVPWSRRAIVREALRHDVVISICLPPYLLALAPLHRPLMVSDQYDPLERELATLTSSSYRERELSSRSAIRALQLRHADLILCAGTRQREEIVRAAGALDAGGTPSTPVVVPFGLPDPPARSGRRPLRERFPQIGERDTVVLWWGSVWRWLDAETAIRACARIARTRGDVKLVITAGRAPNRKTDRFSATEQARALAAELGVLGESVLFLDEWIPYEERHHYLQDADIGLTLNRDAAEAELAARVRYMDYLWAGLPCVLGRGDEIAAELEAGGFATLIDEGDEQALVAALLGLADNPRALERAREHGRRLARERQWSAVGATLREAIDGASRRHSAAGVTRVSGASAYYARRLVHRGTELAGSARAAAG
jgi:glycosyltransferase involved in cell wall biosynthesis